MATLNTKVRVVPKEFRNKRIYTGSVIYSSTATAQGDDAEPEGYTAGTGLELTGNEFAVEDGGIDTTQLAADAVDGTRVADDAIDSEHYTDGSIDHVHLAADCIDGDNIQDDAIDSEHYAAGSINYDHLSADCWGQHIYAGYTSISNGTYSALDMDGSHWLTLVTGSGNITLQGISNGYVGQVIYCIKAATSNSVTIEHNSGSAAAGDKIFTNDGSNTVFSGGYKRAFMLMYDGTDWILME